MPNSYPSANNNFKGLDPDNLNPNRGVLSPVINCYGEEVELTFNESCLLYQLILYSPYSLTSGFLCDVVLRQHEGTQLSIFGRGNQLRRFEDKIGCDLEDRNAPQIFRYRSWLERQARSVTGTGFSWQIPAQERVFTIADLPDWNYLRMMMNSVMPPDVFASGVFRPEMAELRRRNGGERTVSLARIDYCLLNLLAAETKSKDGRFLSIEKIFSILYPKSIYPNLDLNKSRYGAMVTQMSRLRENVAKLGIDISNERVSDEKESYGYRIDY